MVETDLTVPAVPSLKMLREALCVAQTAIRFQTEVSALIAPSGAVADRLRTMAGHRTTDLQRVIDAIDYQRPLGSDGKHGELHTENCGCDRDEREPNGHYQDRDGWSGRGV